MAIVVNREIAGDLNNPTAELLNYCIQEHMKMLRRLEKLSDYYDGKHDITKRKKENEAAPNNKILVNHAKYVVDMNVGFMVGNPISYVSRMQLKISNLYWTYITNWISFHMIQSLKKTYLHSALLMNCFISQEGKK